MKPKCVICKKLHNPKSKSGNYGWHYTKEGNVEKCAYSILPMQMMTNNIIRKPFEYKWKSIKYGELK